MVACPLVLFARPWHPEPDVEALTRRIVSPFVVGVGVAEAVVACSHEAAHGFGVTKTGEVCSSPRLVFFRGVGVGVRRCCGGEVEGETLVES